MENWVKRNWKNSGKPLSNVNLNLKDGYHILWQFSDRATGNWHCAVLNEANEWDRFRMDLGDIEQRREFWAGKVPPSADRL
jgi:hypothetical protein